MAISGKDKPLEELIDQLPPDRRAAVKDFAQFLLEREQGKEDRRLSLSWAGALRDLKDEVTSEQLEDEALDLWRGKGG